MKKRNMLNRQSRVIARGEISGHSHIVIGECLVFEKENEVFIEAGKNCAIKHLLEQPFIEEGIEKFTGEHLELPMQEGATYKFIQQREYNPYSKAIERVQD